MLLIPRHDHFGRMPDKVNTFLFFRSLEGNFTTTFVCNAVKDSHNFSGGMPTVKWAFFFTCTRNVDGEIDSTKNVRDCLVLFACCFTASTHEEWHLKSLTKRKRTARRTDPSHWCIKHWAAENSAAVICSRGNPTIHNPKMRKTRRRGEILASNKHVWRMKKKNE